MKITIDERLEILEKKNFESDAKETIHQTLVERNPETRFFEQMGNICGFLQIKKMK